MNKKKGKEIAKAKEAPIASFNIETLIAQAITKGVPVATMKEMLAMRKELKAEWAKEEYDKSMAGFQSECSPIKKTKSVNTDSGKKAYSYSPIEVLDAETKDLRQKYGFSYSSNMYIVDSNIKIILEVTHKSGHSKLTEMTVPLGSKTNIMSQSQVTAAAATFAKRHAFINAFGITMVDEDDETILKKADVKAEAAAGIPEEITKKMSEITDLNELLAYCKSQMTVLKAEHHNSLRLAYTFRKSEIEAAKIADEAAEALEKQEVSA